MKLPRTRAVKGKRASADTLSRLLVYAPMALQVIGLIRRSQKVRRGKYVKARKRDRALDFLLGQAERKMGSAGRRRR
ncbi:hypothetical protein QR90_09665 [Deinococcus radiopugnans]|uniref:Uncharacterized protein n=2 Tax=Deinococcus radiopugnans TaxID=57497 RepID=A0A0A7KGS5_9DEIO|nr:hypothetical protein [Deinococcus radiopugnans]AIZ45310.1 hypothetical protein QR90_09665 [Deinococcus radiopugnans]MBB6015166.1 hypothetical protein [Deinococcus radiopugnans ATCC 19172]QLG10533.1 hypothetical protein HLB42_06945 [Deinococcus sp. D7000]TNM70879.1 hypothetical protein FHR04_10320 [Deinococcus radiopugnans ATCC 19172]